MKKLPYSEGTIFLVPLRNGGYARGVVARAGRNGKVLYGYFFGPRLSITEAAEATKFGNLNPSKALLKVLFGDLGLINGEWPVRGRIADWDRTEWPMPDFVSVDPTGHKKLMRVRYSDTDPGRFISQVSTTEDHGLERDSLAGYGAVEIKLTKLLGGPA